MAVYVNTGGRWTQCPDKSHIEYVAYGKSDGQKNTTTPGDCTGSACTATCAKSCTGTNYIACTSCDGECSTSCVSTCSNVSQSGDFEQVSCAGGCTGSCFGCSQACTSTCTSCTGSCENSCTGGCTGSCVEGCSGTCTGSCKGQSTVSTSVKVGGTWKSSHLNDRKINNGNSWRSF